MDDIARELGISKKTLYVEFRDKNDLIDQVVDYDIEQNNHFLEEVHHCGAKAVEELFLINRQIHSIQSRYSPTYYYDLRRYAPDAFGKWIDQKSKNIFELITSNLKKGKGEWVYRTEIDETIIGRIHMARIEMLETNGINESNEPVNSRLIQEVFIYRG